MSTPANPSIAILIPCRNEAVSIGKVVADFRRALPAATIYVYDNGSTDGTAERARAAGAVVRREIRPGKGNVVRRMFADVEAELYLLVDGDDTYDATAAPRLVEHLLAQSSDMVVAARGSGTPGAFRRGHRLGNRILAGLVSQTFGRDAGDMTSGYRAFSRRFVKSFPAQSGGFEIEVEITIHALELDMPIDQIEAPYKPRPEGSRSKLSTWRDGTRVLSAIVALTKDERPLPFFGALGALIAALSLVLGTPVVLEFLRSGLVPRLPTALLATGLMVLAFLSLASGLILDTVTRGRREMKRLSYLSLPGPSTDRAAGR